MFRNSAYWFTVNVHHTSSPLGHCKKLDQRKRGIRIDCITIYLKEIGNPTFCQEPHNPTIVCEPLERDYNEWGTTHTLWPSKYWKHLLVTLVHHFFAKLWAIKQGPMSWNTTWKWATINNSWVWLDGLQQKLNWKCGFYVIKFITSYCGWKYVN